MTFKLKLISPKGVASALAKAERYRLLNEPQEAESICRDVLAIDSDDQRALVTLLLSLTDQFGEKSVVDARHAEEVLARVRDPYERAYYAGIISERRAKAQLKHSMPSHGAYDWFSDAMSWYDKAAALSPEGNDDAVLRWNTCARIIEQHKLVPAPDSSDLDFGDSAPSV